MDAILKMKSDEKRKLWDHLLPHDLSKEQAAFIFCNFREIDEIIEFEVADMHLLIATDFAAQYGDYLELKDITRISLIKRAHTLGASLVELHSHPSPFPAAFSYSDRIGLLQTVPHMRWRLNKRPYIAVVVAPSGFDALIWRSDDLKPEALKGMQVGDILETPTNISIGEWHG